MSEQTPISDPFGPLLDAACDNTLAGPQIQELAALLSADATVRKAYIDHIHLRRNIRSVCRTERTCDAGLAQVRAMLPQTATPDSPLPNFSLISPTLHGTVGYFSSGWPVAYLVATVVVGVGLLIGGYVSVSTPVQVVETSIPHPSPLAPSLSPKAEFVGRITGMVDCQWTDRSTATLDRASVPIGRKYALASGLMEITYDTGARVILQGPVTYEVESRDSGYLSVGKLIARVEKKEERRTKNEERPASSSSFLIPHSYFAVRTPTATVTDLGTEFGVEVDKNGIAEVHVYQGEVISRPNAVGSNEATAVHVKAGHAVRIDPECKKHVTVAFAPRGFVRKVSPLQQAEPAYINAVLADKPLAYWPLNERAYSCEYVDRSGNNFYGRANDNVVSGKPGPFGPRSLAIELDGNGYIDTPLTPDREKLFAELNALTVEAWVWIAKSNEIGQILSVDGQQNGIRSGWGVAYVPRFSQFLFANYSVNNYYLGAIDTSQQQRWLHVAIIYDNANTVRFYLNGDLRQSAGWPKSRMTGSARVAIGRMTTGGRDWRGRLAHVAIYARALGDQDIHNHYKAGTEKEEEASMHDP